jgi:hypothetical protein
VALVVQPDQQAQPDQQPRLDRLLRLLVVLVVRRLLPRPLVPVVTAVTDPLVVRSEHPPTTHRLA